MIWNDQKLITILKEGGVAVMPTDTIYGLVGQANNREVVERIYQTKKRAPTKACIILISNIGDLEKFSIILQEEEKEKIKEFWPGPVSVILECVDDALFYLHRGTNTLAFRMPQPKELRDLLAETGPLIAPSANPEALPPAKSIPEARVYFGGSVDYYLDGGEIEGNPSKLVKLHKDGSITILR